MRFFPGHAVAAGLLATLAPWTDAQRTSRQGSPTRQVSAPAPPARPKLLQRIGPDLPGFGEQLVAGGDFGYSVAPLGDLDGNGVPDVAVVAPHEAPGGVLYLLFLDRAGRVAGQRRISATEGGFSGDLAACGCGFIFVDAIGDLNGDGVVDLAVGAPTDPSGGSVWILFLAPDGSVAAEQRIADGVGGLAAGTLQPDVVLSSYFGWSLTGIGDQDGDGTPDLAVGAPGQQEDGGDGIGAIFVLRMNPDGTVRDHGELAAGSTPPGSYFFGKSTAGVGDLDGNGVPDLATSYNWSPDLETLQEDVAILLMNADGTVSSTHVLDSVAMDILTCCWWTMDFGRSIAPVGDLDGDGLPELAVGKPAGDSWGTPSIFLFELAADGSLVSSTEIADQVPYAGLSLQVDSRFGWALTSPGDIDGDGKNDLVVGAPSTTFLDGAVEQEMGELWVLFHLP